MCFNWPEHLDYLYLLMVLLLLVGYGIIMKLKARASVADSELQESMMPRISILKLVLRRVMVLAGGALLLVAFAGPQFCKGDKPVRRKGVDVVFMLDISNSMLARDILPDRLSQAKFEILQISRRIGEGRKGLMLFAGSPLMQCPLTTDQTAFESLLDMASPDLIETQGTVYRRSLELAVRMADPAVSGGAGDKFQGEKVVVLLSDGEDHQEDFRNVAEELKKKGIHFYAIGIGSGNAVSIPLPASGTTAAGEKRDSRGDVVLTRLRPDILGTLAGEVGGRLYLSKTADRPVYPDVSGDIERMAATTRWVMTPAEREPLGRYFMIGGILLLFLEMQMTDSRGSWRERKRNKS